MRRRSPAPAAQGPEKVAPRNGQGPTLLGHVGTGCQYGTIGIDDVEATQFATFVPQSGKFRRPNQGIRPALGRCHARLRFIDSLDGVGDFAECIGDAVSVGQFDLRSLGAGDVVLRDDPAAVPADAHVQWIVDTNKREDVYDSEPEVGGWTKLKLLLFSPFVDEGLL